MDKLFNEFQSPTKQQWLDTIKTDLKGADIEKLVRTTIDGLKINPFYIKEETENLPITNTLPDKFPFLRGYKVNNDWTIRQDYFFSNANETNSKATKALEKQVNRAGFNFGKKFNLNQNDLENLLNGIDNVAFESYENIEVVLDLLKKSTAKPSFASINFDPVTYYAFNGTFYKNQEELWNKAGELLSNDKKEFKTVGINVNHYANAGATPVMQLAFALAIAAEYFSFATEKNISFEKVLANISFNFAVGTEYFLEISKFRAFRYLYAKFVEAYDSNLKDKAKTYVHAVTQRRNKTIYDAHVNTLRTTIEALAAVIGGVDSLNVESFNQVFAKSDDFSERIAVNQQILLKEEAYTNKVVDTAGGSYLIENMTVNLIEKAWELFLKIQENGGFCDSIRSNMISSLVNEIANKELANVETGRISILGTNKFPNRTENLSKLKIEKPCEISDFAIADAPFKTLKIERLSEKFEELRQKVEKSQSFPKVFLLTYGNVAMRRARADFSGNFFACAGFEIIDNNGFETIEQGIDEAKKSNAQFIILCSSDDMYLDIATKVCNALNNKVIIVAGNPENKNEIEQAGVKHFIHIKSNTFKELVEFQKLMN